MDIRKYFRETKTDGLQIGGKIRDIFRMAFFFQIGQILPELDHFRRAEVIFEDIQDTGIFKKTPPRTGLIIFTGFGEITGRIHKQNGKLVQILYLGIETDFLVRGSRIQRSQTSGRNAIERAALAGLGTLFD